LQALEPLRGHVIASGHIEDGTDTSVGADLLLDDGYAHADQWQSDNDWAWLAGVLEGEGSFIRNNGTSQCALKMADRDVVERAASIMGGTVRERKPHRGTKPLWEIAVYGDNAIRMMKGVRRWMGDRRGARIDELLALASQPGQELGFLDQPPVSAIFDDTITKRLSKTRQMLEKKLASQPEVKP